MSSSVVKMLNKTGPIAASLFDPTKRYLNSRGSLITQADKLLMDRNEISQNNIQRYKQSFQRSAKEFVRPLTSNHPSQNLKVKRNITRNTLVYQNNAALNNASSSSYSKIQQYGTINSQENYINNTTVSDDQKKSNMQKSHSNLMVRGNKNRDFSGLRRTIDVQGSATADGAQQLIGGQGFINSTFHQSHLTPDIQIPSVESIDLIKQFSAETLENLHDKSHVQMIHVGSGNSFKKMQNISEFKNYMHLIKTSKDSIK